MESYHRIDRDLGVVFQLITGRADLYGLAAAFRRIQSDSGYVDGLDFLIDASECLIGVEGVGLEEVAATIGTAMEGMGGRAFLVVDRWLQPSLAGFSCEEPGYGEGRVRCFHSKREAMDSLGVSYVATA